MYTGSNKTALSSQEQIADAFVRLLRENSYVNISISAVCKEAGTSRQTFYSLFESRENIILYELSKKHSFQPADTCPCNCTPLKAIAGEYSSYIAEKQEFLSLLVKNDLIYLMHQCLFDAFMGCSFFCEDLPERERTFAAEFMAGGLAGIAKTYILDGCTLSRRELEQIIYKLFQGELF
ncbi:MAG: TetR/AcrR family transcriptional regulator [Lachnospiraceae bacterium]|nr:TetR/AcrR family transcriptional regulator [Lachnospiraceae bacterium]